MIRDVPLYTSGGTDPFTNLPTGGGPITGNGSNGQLLRFHSNYARLLIFITSLSGTSPSVQFTVGSYYGSNFYTLPPITSPIYIYAVSYTHLTLPTIYSV